MRSLSLFLLYLLAGVPKSDSGLPAFHPCWRRSICQFRTAWAMLFPVHHRGWELSFLAPSFDIQVVDEDIPTFIASHPFRPWPEFRENGSHPASPTTMQPLQWGIPPGR